MDIKIPTQDEIDGAMFLIRWGQYALIGLAGLAGIGYVATKGKQECDIVNSTPTSGISKEHIENLIKIGILDSEIKLREEFKSDLSTFRSALLQDITRLLDAKLP